MSEITDRFLQKTPFGTSICFSCHGHCTRREILIYKVDYQEKTMDLLTIEGRLPMDLRGIRRRRQIYGVRRAWRYQRGNQIPYIEEEQTTQWPKEKVQKDKQRSTKHTYKTKDRVTRTPLNVLFIIWWEKYKYPYVTKHIGCMMSKGIIRKVSTVPLWIITLIKKIKQFHLNTSFFSRIKFCHTWRRCSPISEKISFVA